MRTGTARASRLPRVSAPSGPARETIHPRPARHALDVDCPDVRHETSEERPTALAAAGSRSCRRDPLALLVLRGPRKAGDQLVAALDRVVQRLLRLFLVRPHGFELLVDDVADLDEVAEA